MTTPYYILPNLSCVILGGTKETGSFDVTPDDAVTQRIIDGCAQLVPSLKQAPIIRVQAGLRPGRSSIRLEVDPKDSAIVHNYGHGGSGVTLAWGSALKVAQLLQKVQLTSL